MSLFKLFHLDLALVSQIYLEIHPFLLNSPVWWNTDFLKYIFYESLTFPGVCCNIFFPTLILLICILLLLIWLKICQSC